MTRRACDDLLDEPGVNLLEETEVNFLEELVVDLLEDAAVGFFEELEVDLLVEPAVDFFDELVLAFFEELAVDLLDELTIAFFVAAAVDLLEEPAVDFFDELAVDFFEGTSELYFVTRVVEWTVTPFTVCGTTLVNVVYVPLSSFTNRSTSTHPGKPFAAPVSTILFVPKSHSSSSSSSSSSDVAESNIPEGAHWTDMPGPGTFAVLQQPPGQSCAVMGDILATRLKVRGVKGAVVDGRVRDLTALSSLVSESEDAGSFHIWNKATSTVGTGMEAKAWAFDVPLTIGHVTARPGDILFVDSEERGAVVIPQDKLDEVLKMLPGLKAADDAVVADVQMGMNVQEAFKKHRGT
ncbi:hypothetical protein MBLNU459_g1070t1 [Dothideomycetes sp. NU459]